MGIYSFSFESTCPIETIENIVKIINGGAFGVLLTPKNIQLGALNSPVKFFQQLTGAADFDFKDLQTLIFIARGMVNNDEFKKTAYSLALDYYMGKQK